MSDDSDDNAAIQQQARVHQPPQQPAAIQQPTQQPAVIQQPPQQPAPVVQPVPVQQPLQQQAPVQGRLIYIINKRERNLPYRAPYTYLITLKKSSLVNFTSSPYRF